MVPDAQVSHAIPRRVRIRIPSKKGCASYFDQVLERMAECQGVDEVRVNPSTGTIVVRYDCTMEALVEHARSNGLFSLAQATPPPRTLFQDVAATFQSYNRTLKGITGGEVDIPSLVFLSLLASGIWQVARGNLVMPAWYTAFYYALGVFTSARVDEFDPGEALTGEVEDPGLD